MLQYLHIKHFALIEDVHIHFGDGLTIFTGETGAGKSILLDAIGMLAGKRASASFVRQGTESFWVEGAFFLSTPDEALQRILLENHIEMEDGQLVIARKWQRNGRGTVLVNGTLVPLVVAKQIGDYLLDIHGQYDNRLIFDPLYHVDLLDGLTPKVQAARAAYDEVYRTWQTLAHEVKKLSHDESEKARLLSVLDFQIKEIEKHNLKIGEDEALEKKVRLAAKGEHIKNNMRELVYTFDGSDRQAGVLEQAETVQRLLGKMGTYEPLFQQVEARWETLVYELKDVYESLVTYADDVEFDEQALDAMQERLAKMEKLKRKYGPSIEDILAFLQHAKQEYQQLEDVDNQLARVKKKLVAAQQQAKEKAQALYDVRLHVAKQFQQSMTETLGKLGMPHSQIRFHIEPMETVTAIGAKVVELYFSANKGEAVQPLAKIASGGEVSRIALALKSIGERKQSDKTRIFDEIDVGISGQTGVQVAKHMHQLCQQEQVFCITHLPQTAAAADKHYVIYKKEEKGRTISQVKLLSPQEHVQEIARMFTGDDVREEGIEAARTLIRQSKEADEKGNSLT